MSMKLNNFLREDKLSKIKKGRAYMVKWVDSCGTPAGWIDLSEEDYPADIS